MKMFGLTAIVALALAGCQKMAQTEEALPPVSTPAPVANPRLAPEGVFYLVAPAQVETPSGVIRLAVGTGVRRLRPGVYLTPSGEAALRDDQVTNDLDRARQARDAAQAREAAEATARAAVAAPPRRAATPEPWIPPEYQRPVEGVVTQPSGLQTSTALGTGHTRTKDGIVWQKSLDGKYWLSVKYLRSGHAVSPVRSEKVQ
jgi:hypothetical protein